MFRSICCLLVLMGASVSNAVETTGLGKIIYTQGHTAPNCRTVAHEANGSGVVKLFRLHDVTGDDDISSIILTALIANRDVDIVFDSTQTTTCGTEPGIIHVTVY